jgi:hypothetical protein
MAVTSMAAAGPAQCTMCPVPVAPSVCPWDSCATGDRSAQTAGMRALTPPVSVGGHCSAQPDRLDVSLPKHQPQLCPCSVSR